MTATTGVLLMSFGAVDRIEDIPAYYTNIRGGRIPTSEQLGNLRVRYERIGGRSPLLGILQRQAHGIQQRLRGAGYDVPVEVGMKFWTPFIGDALRHLSQSGVQRVVALTMGPYYSTISVGGYQKFLEAAQSTLAAPVVLDLVPYWYNAPGLDAAWEEKIHEALRTRGWTPESTYVIFTNHSLPERILVLNDPYGEQFFEHGRRLAQRLRLPHWGYSYQSAGAILTERWLGPDILEALDHLKQAGRKRILVVPIGFSADHLEILHDLDVEARQRADELGLEFARTASLNEAPQFLDALSALLEARVRAAPAVALGVGTARRA